MTVKEFIEELPQKVDPASIEGHNTSFHFDLTGDETCQYTLTMVDGKLESQEGLIGEAKCVVKGDSGDFIKLSQGEINPMMAILTGKIKISNQGEMLKYAKIFGLM